MYIMYPCKRRYLTTHRYTLTISSDLLQPNGVEFLSRLMWKYTTEIKNRMIMICFLFISILEAWSGYNQMTSVLKVLRKRKFPISTRLFLRNERITVRCIPLSSLSHEHVSAKKNESGNQKVMQSRMNNRELALTVVGTWVLIMFFGETTSDFRQRHQNQLPNLI